VGTRTPGREEPAEEVQAQEEGFVDDGFTRIQPGVEMSGRLVTERSLRVDGEFRGQIESAAMVIVCETGAVEAPIRARTVEIRGAVVGDVVASREVVIHATGRLHGDVEAPSFVIERGAFFNGRTRMYRPERLAQSQAEALPAEGSALASDAPSPPPEARSVAPAPGPEPAVAR